MQQRRGDHRVVAAVAAGEQGDASRDGGCRAQVGLAQLAGVGRVRRSATPRSRPARRSSSATSGFSGALLPGAAATCQAYEGTVRIGSSMEGQRPIAAALADGPAAALLAEVIGAASEGIAIVTAEGSVALANPAAAQLLGRDPEALLEHARSSSSSTASTSAPTSPSAPPPASDRADGTEVELEIRVVEIGARGRPRRLHPRPQRPGRARGAPAADQRARSAHRPAQPAPLRGRRREGAGPLRPLWRRRPARARGRRLHRDQRPRRLPARRRAAARGRGRDRGAGPRDRHRRPARRRRVRDRADRGLGRARPRDRRRPRAV